MLNNFSQIKNECSVLTFGNENITKLSQGIQILSRAVGATLGGRGKTVIIQTNDGKFIQTKDGVTVANAINLEDSIQDTGCQIVKNVAKNVVKEAGDGTTTSIVLTNSVIALAVTYMNNGIINAHDICDVIDFIQRRGLEFLEKSKRKVVTRKHVESIASISANNDKEIADLIIKALEYSSESGTINLEKSDTVNSFVEITKGYSFNRGYLNENFKDRDEVYVTYRNPIIFISKDELVGAEEVSDLIDIAINEQRPLVIIAKDFKNMALNQLTLNYIRQGIPILPIKAPGFGQRQLDLLDDIAIYTGTTVFSKEHQYQFSDIDSKSLGQCDYIKSTSDETFLIGENGDEIQIENRINGLRLKLEDTKNREKHPDFEDKLEERIAKFTCGIVTIKVGGYTELEQKEKYDRFEDALLATENALKTGYVIGGGLFYVGLFQSLIRFMVSESNNLRKGKSQYSESFINALALLAPSLLAPHIQILANANLMTEETIEELSLNDVNKSKFYDVVKGEKVSYYKTGIIDAAKIAESILKNSLSICKTLLLAECTVNRKVEYFNVVS